MKHKGQYERTEWPVGFASEPHERELTKRKKSAVFAMATDLILTSKFPGWEGGFVGDFTFRYDYAGLWEGIIPEMAAVVKKGWKLNDMLCRAHKSRLMKKTRTTRARFENK
jgi:hypothetical protein